MISNYEHMLISAVRYALGRKTNIVGITVDYVIKEIPKLSARCKRLMLLDIENPLYGYGDDCDKRKWMQLLEELKGGTK